eukprot:SM013168S27052  [mRNA]  locus=s13168:194:310:- [translate_table: standard]
MATRLCLHFLQRTQIQSCSDCRLCLRVCVAALPLLPLPP